jgi:senataxin
MYSCIHTHTHTPVDTQYRMHPHISVFPNRHFYEGKIKNGENVSGYK